jgi:hypothetical protein
MKTLSNVYAHLEGFELGVDPLVGAGVITDPPEGDEGDTPPVTLPAGDPAVLLGLSELMHPEAPFCTVIRLELPPVPIPRESPATSSTTVPARTFTNHSKAVLPVGGSSRKVVPPGMTPYMLTCP